MINLTETIVEDYKRTIERLQQECTEKSNMIFMIGESLNQVQSELSNFAAVISKASGLESSVAIPSSSIFEESPVLKVKKVKEIAEIPQYQTEGSSGMDLCATIDNTIIIPPFQRVFIPTGLSIELPFGYEAQIRPRSGLSSKHGVTLVNCVGTIDSDYRGEIIVPLINLSNTAYSIQPGERIAQMVISKYEKMNIKEVKELSLTERGKGGFGSTGAL